MMRRWSLLGFAIVLIGALIYLNRGIAVNTGQVQSTTASTPPAPTPAVAKPTPAGAKPAGVQTSPSVVAEGAPPPSVQVIGHPATARLHYLVGWDFNSANLAHPQTLTAALQTIRQYVQSQPDASAVIVDIDVPPAERPVEARSVKQIGIWLNGHSVPGLAADPGEGTATASLIQQKLKSVG
jgi:hypothetical protein